MIWCFSPRHRSDARRRRCALPVSGVAVVELRDRSASKNLDELAVAARFLGDGHSQQRFAPLPNLGPLRNVAKPVEVHVCAAVDRDQPTPLQLFANRILLQPREADGARGSGMARVSSKMSFTAAQISSVSTVMTSSRSRGTDEKSRSCLPHRDPIGEQADMIEPHAFTGRDGCPHAGCVLGLDTDHLDVRPQELDVRGDTGGQTTAPDLHKDRLERIRMLTQEFHAHGALAGDDIRIVIGVDEGCPCLALDASRVDIGLVEGVAVQHDYGRRGLSQPAP